MYRVKNISQTEKNPPRSMTLKGDFDGLYPKTTFWESKGVAGRGKKDMRKSSFSQYMNNYSLVKKMKKLTMYISYWILYFKYTHYIPSSFEYLILHNRISSLMKERCELIECESMIIPRVYTDLDIVVSISTMTLCISRLFTEIPIRHVDPTSWLEE